MLQEVGIELALLHLQIRLHVIGKELDARIDALRPELRFQELRDFGVTGR
jgi:hypothetical protein